MECKNILIGSLIAFLIVLTPPLKSVIYRSSIWCNGKQKIFMLGDFHSYRQAVERPQALILNELIAQLPSNTHLIVEDKLDFQKSLLHWNFAKRKLDNRGSYFAWLNPNDTLERKVLKSDYKNIFRPHYREGLCFSGLVGYIKKQNNAKISAENVDFRDPESSSQDKLDRKLAEVSVFMETTPCESVTVNLRNMVRKKIKELKPISYWLFRSKSIATDLIALMSIIQAIERKQDTIGILMGGAHIFHIETMLPELGFKKIYQRQLPPRSLSLYENEQLPFANKYMIKDIVNTLSDQKILVPHASRFTLCSLTSKNIITPIDKTPPIIRFSHNPMTHTLLAAQPIKTTLTLMRSSLSHVLPKPPKIQLPDFNCTPQAVSKRSTNLF